MTEQDIIALRFYIETLNKTIQQHRELRQRANRNIRVELLGPPNSPDVMREIMLRQAEMEMQSNIDVVYAIRMELLLRDHRDELAKHGLEFPELPLAFDEMEEETGTEPYGGRPPEDELN
jgi:hypothetical protein